MRYFFGLIVVGALLGSASVANAQLSIAVGNPYGGYGTGYYGVPYATSSYSAYSTYVAPGTTFYSSGYSGYAYPSVAPTYLAPVAPVYAPAYGYGYVPAYRYGPVYGYGYRRGIPGLNRIFGGYGIPF